MRILRRKEFLALPPGVVFCAGDQWSFGSLEVKSDTLSANDFVSLDLNSVDASDSGELFELMDSMLQTGASFPINKDFGRDGGFKDDEIYLVYEPEDLQFLIELFTAAKAL